MHRIGWTLLFVFWVGAATVLAPPPLTTPREPVARLTTTPAAPSSALPGRHVPRNRRPAAVPGPVRPSLPSLPISPAAFALFPVVHPSVPVSPVAPVNAYALPASPVLPALVSPPSAFPSRLLFRPARSRPGALVPMYASFATLQALDYHSTTRALSEGTARESNPLVRPIVDHRPAFIAVKAAATAAIVFQAERLWKDHPVRAIVFMVAANGAMAAIVAHNYSIK